MYYPYLRARQFELISIRELAIEHSIQDNIIPVLEPVKNPESSLNIANKVLLETGQGAYLIMNPIVGDLKGDREVFSDYLSSLEESAFRPAFHYTNNADFILALIDKYGFSDCMIICITGYTDDNILRNLCNSPAITHFMVLDPQKNRSLDRFLKSTGKIYIRLDDIFEKQEKNADFLDIAAHKFSEEHLYYAEDGYNGFADFTVLPSEYTEGGSTPRAVVIHLTYINDEEEEQIWIRHFTSITNDSIANVQGKFAEAAAKAVEFCQNHDLENSAIIELTEYFEEKKYPGLGIVKKISIKNHLLVVSSFLS